MVTAFSWVCVILAPVMIYAVVVDGMVIPYWVGIPLLAIVACNILHFRIRGRCIGEPRRSVK